MSAPEDSRRGVVKSAATITILTFLSRILGLVREQVRGFYLGTGSSSDAFGLAATIPNLFRRLLAEGAMTAAFIPVFSGYVKKGDRAALTEFFANFISLFTFVTTVVCVLGMVFADTIVETFFASGFGQVEGKLALTILLTQIMFPYLGIVSLAAIIQAVLNSFRVFAPSAFTPVLLNLSIILCAVLLQGFFPDPSYAFATGFLIGGVVQLAFQLPWFLKVGMRFRISFNWRHKGVRELMRIFIPGAFAAGIYQINVFVSQMIAASLDEGSIAALQYSIRLQELVLGVFVVSVTTVILPTLARQHAAGDNRGFHNTNILALDMMALITIPASMGLLALRHPIVDLLFEQGAFDSQSTDLTSFAVLFHSLGVYFIASSRSLNQTFYAMKDLKTPTLIAAIAMGVNIAGCYLLSIPLGHGGIALANSLSALATAALLFWFLHRRGIDVRFLRHASLLARLSIAGGGMVALLYALQTWCPSGSEAGKTTLGLYLLLYIAAGAVGFLLLSLVVARKELLQLLVLVTRGGGHNGD